MKDHIWEHNNRYRLVKVEGQQDQYDLIPVPGTVYQVGTPINKATLLQDTIYSKYKNASKTTMPNLDSATPNDVFGALENAYANGFSIIMGESKSVGANRDEEEGFAKWDTILYDATGKCTLDTNFNSKNYCTKLYIPKGIKKVQITGKFGHNKEMWGSSDAIIYKNGVKLQSIKWNNDVYNQSIHEVINTVIDTTGAGNEYIQIYFKGSGGTTERGVVVCFWLIVKMLSF